MQLYRLEVRGPLYGSLGVKGLIQFATSSSSCPCALNILLSTLFSLILKPCCALKSHW